MKVIKQIPTDVHFPIVEIALDQVMHITVLAAAALGSVWFGI